MIIAIYSDVHANLPAFEAYRKDSQGVDKQFFLGDVVGYGGKPNECIEGVRDLSDMILLGNHDAAVCGLEELEIFKKPAQTSISWTRGKLSETNYIWLRTLKRQYEDEELNVCLNHSASGDENDRWRYVYNIEDAAVVMTMTDKKISFVGHTHIPEAYATTDDGWSKGFPIDLKNVEKVLINVGAVGQPRDEDPRGSYVIYDTDKEVVELHRFEYDIEKAMQDIVKAGLPEEHALRLKMGK